MGSMRRTERGWRSWLSCCQRAATGEDEGVMRIRRMERFMTEEGIAEF